ncbi:MAG: hypothetical protein NTV25_04115 [Methanothrix sp.]|nr:hypothetical protein [Methanothrix sp.]
MANGACREQGHARPKGTAFHDHERAAGDGGERGERAMVVVMGAGTAME